MQAAPHTAPSLLPVFWLLGLVLKPPARLTAVKASGPVCLLEGHWEERSKGKIFRELRECGGPP